MQINADKIRNNKVVKFLFSRDFATFSFFLLFAFVLWLMHGTNMRREIKVKVPLEYINISEQIHFETQIQKYLTVTIKDQGIELWQYIRKDMDTLYVDMANMFDKSGELEMSSDILAQQIKSRLAVSTQIVDVEPKKLMARYKLLQSKAVPFVLNAVPNLNLHYVLSEDIRIEPSEATIYGEKAVIDTINYIFISVPNQKIEKTGRYQFNIEKHRYNCRIEPNNPYTFVAIEMSTEKKISIPIKVKNMPDDMSCVTFPSSVDAIFSVGVSKFSEIEVDDFSIELDYNELKNNKTGKVDVFLDYQPSNIYNLKLSTLEVEFILRNK